MRIAIFPGPTSPALRDYNTMTNLRVQRIYVTPELCEVFRLTKYGVVHQIYQQGCMTETIRQGRG